MSAPDDMESLRRENRDLRARLDAVESDARAARERQRWVLKRGGSLFVPLIDRNQVVRNFVHLFRTTSGFAGPRESWPKREDLQASAEAFGVSLLRFFVRRRLFYLVISLIAMTMPVLQVWLLVRQNELVDLQNQLIQIQADDIVARGMTTDNMVANQLNGALLSAREFPRLSDMMKRIFGAQLSYGDLVARDEGDERKLYFKMTASRAHLLIALAEGIKDPVTKDQAKAAPLWRMLTGPETGSLRQVVQDAASRTPPLLRTPKGAFGSPQVEIECQRYLVGVSLVLRHAFQLARAADERRAYFEIVAPFFEKVSIHGNADGSLKPAFAQLFQDLFLDFHLEPTWGAPEPPIPGDVNAALANGFARLQQELGRAKVNWAGLKTLVELR